MSSTASNRIHSISALIIGDELLSGKVTDDNSPFLIRELRMLGSRLHSIHVLPDQISVLSEYIRNTSNAHDYVITSGGLGPTHDDLTLNAVAKAFEVEMSVHEEFKEILENVYGERATDTILEMAYLPVGTQFEWGETLDIPALRYENVFVLPGEPRLFRTKFAAIKQAIRSNNQFYSRSLYFTLKESELADRLRDLQNEYPEVNIGSYPSPWSEEYQDMVSIESPEEEKVNQVTRALLETVPEDTLVRQEEQS